MCLNDVADFCCIVLSLPCNRKCQPQPSTVSSTQWPFPRLLKAYGGGWSSKIVEDTLGLDTNKKLPVCLLCYIFHPVEFTGCGLPASIHPTDQDLLVVYALLGTLGTGMRNSARRLPAFSIQRLTVVSKRSITKSELGKVSMLLY